MVLYLREITLASKSGDSVYAKRLLLKTHFWHPCREAPLGAFKNRGTTKNRHFVYAKCTFSFAMPDGAYPPSRHVPEDVSRLFWSFRKTALSSTRNDYFWDSECKNNSGCVAQGSKRLKKRCFLNEKHTFSETMRAAVGTASQTWCSKHFLIKRLETAPTHRHFAKSGASRNALVGAWPCFLGPASA